MPTPPMPEADLRRGAMARLIGAARAIDLTRLRRMARRAWSRVLMSICLAEARCRPALFRVRPPPAASGHQIILTGAPLDGADPFAHLADRLGLPHGPAGAIARRPHDHPLASLGGRSARAGSGLSRRVTRRRVGPRRARGPNARPEPRRATPVKQSDRTDRLWPGRRPAGSIEDHGLCRSGDTGRSTMPTPPIPAWPMPAGVGAEERACDLGEALILAAGLAGAGLGATLLGGLGACLGLWIGLMVGGSYVERRRDDPE